MKTKLNYFNPCAFRNPLPGEMISDATHPVGSVNPDGVPVKFQAPVTDRATAIALLGGVQNNVYGPGYYQVNMSLFKSFPTFHEQNLQFRADGFNVLNHTNFVGAFAPSGLYAGQSYGIVSQKLNAGDFGQITGAYDPRIFQFALKLAY